MMTSTISAATSARVLNQLRRDPRTVFMIVVVPALLIVLLYYVLSLQPIEMTGMTHFDRLGVTQLGILPCAVMFPITAIAMQRERSSGTLDRLLSTPLAKGDLLAGYGGAFAIAATVQAVVAWFVAFEVLGLHTRGSSALVMLISVADAVLGVAMGLLFSAFARSEYQAVQFAPIVIVPQLFVCGLIVPRDQMPQFLHDVSNWLPLARAVDALQEVSMHPDPTGKMCRGLGIVVIFVFGSLILGAATLRRKTA
jgi:ABC-2 type transport system permease protein